ncbi:MAG: protoheme IX farnesyltransferase [bacterium]|nr:protoheme IX farnesyltransferase [bacterium]
MLNKWLKNFLDLIKIKITIAVSFTTAVGYFLAADKLSLAILAPIIGIFLLASGSSALNQFQERNIDGLMHRTKDRPLPAKRIQTRTAFFVILVLVVAGVFVLYFGTNPLATLLGVFALVWYNGVYTLLKRTTPFATVPGAVIGAIPPMVGWVAGGGDILDPQIILIASFFFIWQVPHFWLLLLLSGDDYERAGLPSLTGVFSMTQISRITFMWMLTTAITSFIVINFGAVHSPFVKIGVVIFSIGLCYQAVKIIRVEKKSLSLKNAFIGINIFALLVIVFLSIDKLINVL